MADTLVGDGGDTLCGDERLVSDTKRSIVVRSRLGLVSRYRTRRCFGRGDRGYRGGMMLAALICTVLGAVGERQVKPGSFPIAALTDAARRTEAVLGSKVISW